MKLRIVLRRLYNATKVCRHAFNLEKTLNKVEPDDSQFQASEIMELASDSEIHLASKRKNLFALGVDVSKLRSKG